jgi:hypothetical protein
VVAADIFDAAVVFATAVIVVVVLSIIVGIWQQGL